VAACGPGSIRQHALGAALGCKYTATSCRGDDPDKEHMLRRSVRDSGHAETRGPSSEIGKGILEASRRVLARGGIEALTVAAVAAEADVYGSAIHYHFGSKEGLKAALVEQLFDEGRMNAEQAIASLPPGPARLAEAMRRFLMIGGPDTELAGFETLGTQLRDENLHRGLMELYDRAREDFVKVLGADADPELAESVRPLATVVFAFLDGMNVAMLIDPGLDETAALATMEEMVIGKLRELGVSWIR
jgi:AcrR family transcriptional regulator